MRYINLLPALLLMAVVTGCGNSSNEDKTTPVSNSTTVPATITPNSNTATTQPVQQQAPVTIQAPVVNTSQPVTQTVSKAGLNPAHGQPGHRCDISVGAPLDSKPTLPSANTTQPVAAQKSAPTLSPNIPAPATVAPGMNPAHGQPGHRCDISVGAPLNSKPAQ
jgi:hypothetical protein